MQHEFVRLAFSPAICYHCGKGGGPVEYGVKLIKGESGAPLIVTVGGGEDAAAVRERAIALAGRDFSLAVITGVDWDASLSPWAAPPVFKKGKPFGGGADKLLAWVEALLPRLIAQNSLSPEYVGIAGYSLAGLFAVYAAYKSRAFSCAASVSGSLWFPGFVDFALKNAPVRVPRFAYFSVGDRESETKNPCLSRARASAETVERRLRELGAETAFELNPGGHFNEPEERLARGMARLIIGMGGNGPAGTCPAAGRKGERSRL